MSEKLRLTFANDMPPASVSVLTPDYRTVAQVWLGPGETREVEAPSTDALVQVRMPSGETATLHDPAQHDLYISRAALASPPPRSLTDEAESLPRSAHPQEMGMWRALQTSASPFRLTTEAPSSDTDLHVALTSEGTLEQAERSPGGEGMLFTYYGNADACDLTVTRGTDPPTTLRVRLPGSLTHLAVSLHGTDAKATLRLRAATRHDVADTLGAYLVRGDLHAAETMTGWVERAEQMLFDKRRDPSAATMGAYLLLRLRRFDLMRTWTRNLADGWPDLADGSVLWAWQLIHSQQTPDEAERYLLQAAHCDDLPVFTEGLRLLFDGLRLLGDEGKAALKQLARRAGAVVWTSPFTASLPQGPLAPRLAIDAGYMTERLPVDSSALDAVGYDDTTGTLEVTFDDGSAYAYYNVPPTLFDALLNAGSKGAYFNEHIKPIGFEYRRLADKN
ncbi:MAG: KTSC domain-containing protein [Bacteroidota bacterium]